MPCEPQDIFTVILVVNAHVLKIVEFFFGFFAVETNEDPIHY